MALKSMRGNRVFNKWPWNFWVNTWTNSKGIIFLKNDFRGTTYLNIER